MVVNFYLKDAKKTKSAVNAVIWFKNRRFKLSTGAAVEVKHWDKENKYIKSDAPDGDFYNSILTRFEGAAKTVFSKYILTGEIPAPDIIKAEINAVLKPGKEKAPATRKAGKKPPSNSFLTFFKDYYENAEYKESTIKKYVTCFNWLTEFEKSYKTRLTFDAVNIDFYDHFKHFILNKTYTPKKGVPARNYSKNYFGSLIKCIKRVLRESGPESRAKLHNNIDYKIRDFRTESEPADAIYLSVTDLLKIHNFNPTPGNITEITKDQRPQNIERKITALNLAKNKFLIGAFTALRVSDFNRLKEINVNENVIKIFPLKGTRKNEIVIIPIHPVIKEILAAGFDIAAPLSDQKLNEHLKELARLVGLNENVIINRTEGGRLVERVYKKWELVTTHTARRSGATNMFISGIPSISIMKITGHKTEISFLKYIKISQEQNARLLAEHPFFK